MRKGENIMKNRFKELRLLHNYSQQYVADKLFVNQTAVSQWERGVTSPNHETLVKLSDMYGVSVDYLLGKSDVPTVQNSKIKNAVREPTDDDIMFALFGGDQDVTEEDYEAVKAFASYIRDKRAKKTSGNNPDIKKD